MKLGDLVYTITKYTGIRWVVKTLSKIFGFDCGCDQRREDWNNITFNRNGRSRQEEVE